MPGLDTAPGTAPEQTRPNVTTQELEAMITEPDNQGAAAEALDNAPAGEVAAAVQEKPDINRDVLEARGTQLDGLRAGVTRAAETTEQLVAEADAREAAGFTPDAQINRKDIVDQQRATNRAHDAVYRQEQMATLQEAADAQAAQYGSKESLRDKLRNWRARRAEAKKGGSEA